MINNKPVRIIKGLENAKMDAIKTAYNNNVTVTVCDRDGKAIQTYKYN